jgi:hypothetical protein
MEKEETETDLAGEAGARAGAGGGLEERDDLGGGGGVPLDGGGAEAERAACVAEARRLVHVLVEPRATGGEVERADEAREPRVRGAEKRQRGAEGRQREEGPGRE